MSWNPGNRRVDIVERLAYKTQHHCLEQNESFVSGKNVIKDFIDNALLTRPTTVWDDLGSIPT